MICATWKFGIPSFRPYCKSLCSCHLFLTLFQTGYCKSQLSGQPTFHSLSCQSYAPESRSVMLCTFVTGSMLISSMHLGIDVKVCLFPPAAVWWVFQTFATRGRWQNSTNEKRQELTKTAKNVGFFFFFFSRWLETKYISQYKLSSMCLPYLMNI